MPFSCHPQPTVTWQYDGQPLPDPKRMKDETIIGMTALTLAKVVRGDAGDYSVTIENENGKVTFTVALTVIGESCCSSASIRSKLRQILR